VDIDKEYPKWKYHWNGKAVKVKNAHEEAALGGGWANTPAAFNAYKGPRQAPVDQQDPVKWVDEWLLGLSCNLRDKVKAAVLRAHAAFWRRPDEASANVNSMQQGFDGVAGVLFEAGILTEQLLQGDIPLLIWDSAIAGGWWRFASETRQDIFPEQVGHYWVWRDENKSWQGLFKAEAAEWMSRLLDVSPQPQTAAALPRRAPKSEHGDRALCATARQAVVMPILNSKRWTRGKWATEAGVGKNSVYEYLAGKRKLSDDNREAMAEVLGLKREQLPN
jgi:hypothetical protein